MLKINENIEQAVFQLRYEYGQFYLDRCGRILREILKDHPEWVVADAPNPQHASLICTDNGCAFNFGIAALDLSLRRDIDGAPISDDDLNLFFKQIEVMTSIVVDRLEIFELRRIGFRQVFCFPVDSKEEAAQWIMNRKCWKVDQRLSSLFDSEPKSESMTLEYDGDDRFFRLAIQAGERGESKIFGSRKHVVRTKDLSRSQQSHLALSEKQKYSKGVIDKARNIRSAEWGRPNIAMVDVDASIDDPESDIQPEKFAKSSNDRILTIVSKIAKGFDK